MAETGVFPDDPQEAYKAGWDDQKKLAEMVRRKRLPSLYALLYPAMAEAAKAHGYALALHGTLGRDMDVIAVPWTEDAADPVTVAKAVGDAVNEYVFSEDIKKAGGKPHGRLGFVIHLEGGAYIDLSVIPAPGESPTGERTLYRLRDGTDTDNRALAELEVLRGRVAKVLRILNVDGPIVSRISAPEEKPVSPKCECGHAGDRHHEEQPYPCDDCGCPAFKLPAPSRPEASEGETKP